MEEAIKVSVVVPTYNRREELRKLLVSLEGQTYPKHNFEIIIVDDGSTDDTEYFVKKYINNHKSHAILYYKQENAGPGAARNVGIERSAGELLLFIDTDCVAPSFWIKKITEPFWNDNTVGVVGGPDTVPQDAPFLMKCINYLMTSFLTTGGLRGGRFRLVAFLPRSFSMAVRKEALEKVGKFSNLRHSEDILLSRKIKKAGYKSLYCHEAFVYHFRRNNIGSFLKQVYEMARGTVIASQSEGRLLRFFNFIPLIAVIIIPVLAFLTLLFLKNFMVLQIYIIIGLSYLIAIFFSCLIETRSLVAAFCAPILFLVLQYFYAFGIISGFHSRIVNR